MYIVSICFQDVGIQKPTPVKSLSPVVGNSRNPRTAEPQIGGRAGVTKVAQEVQPGKGMGRKIPTLGLRGIQDPNHPNPCRFDNCDF